MNPFSYNNICFANNRQHLLYLTVFKEHPNRDKYVYFGDFLKNEQTQFNIL
jgi:hypothetical protein